MSLSAPPVLQFAALLLGGTLAVFAVAARLFLPDEGLVGIGRAILQEDWKWLGTAWLVTQGVNRIARYNTSATFTDLIYRIEGERVAFFQAWTHPWLTAFFTAVYFVGFPFVVLFTYFKVKSVDVEEAHRYAVAYLLLVVLSTPFFVFFPVAVSAARADVAPLIYDAHPIITAGTLSTDTLLKAFPSLHTGLSVVAVLYARKTDRAYAVTIAVVGLLIVISTLYGGIHWLSDAVFAAILALLAYGISRRGPAPRTLAARYSPL
ncbi:MAG: phosphatase PAP2 family protein [Halobacteriaceae archaeon]